MKNFEQKRDEYFNKLKANFEVVEGLTNEANTNKMFDKKTLEILLTPTTEKELEIANLAFDFILDTMSLERDAICGNIEEADLSNSIVIKFYIELINALKSEDKSKTEECKKLLTDLNKPELTAKFSYDFIVSFKGIHYEEAFEKIMEQTGFNSNDLLSLLQFKMYLMKCNEITNPEENKKFDLDDPKQVQFFAEFVRNFHELCNLGKTNQNISDNKKTR